MSDNLPTIKRGKLVPVSQDDFCSMSLTEHCAQVMVHKNSRNRQPLGCPENIAVLLGILNVSLCYNVMTKETEISIPDIMFSQDNYYNSCFSWVAGKMKQIEMSTAHYIQFLDMLADSNIYNPVEEWILSKPWDGESRLAEFYNTIELNDPNDHPLRDALIGRWMLGAVESICNPIGADSPGILVLQGPQGLGKTWWVRKLVDEKILSGAVKVGATIDPNDKDSIEQVVCHWIAEFGELDHIFDSASIGALKNFLTRPKDAFRKSYAARKSEYPRRTAFIATVNEWNYLIDNENRRYWTLACSSVNSYHTIDMQQVWAEVHYLRSQGESYILTAAEKTLLTDINERHTIVDPITEAIIEKYQWETKDSVWRWMTATQVLNEIGYQKPNSYQSKKAAAAIRKINKNLKSRQRRANGRDLLLVPNQKSSIDQYDDCFIHSY